MAKGPMDVIQIGARTVLPTGTPDQLDIAIDLQETKHGYRLVKEWHEDRDVESKLALGSKESRRRWDITIYNTDGDYVADIEMRSDWELVKDLTALPTDYVQNQQHQRG